MRRGDDSQETKHLVQECAYEHWHRMLFARFLAENELLIHPDMGVAVSLEECAELARDEGIDPWELAAGYAQHMLPEVFRQDDPVLQVRLPTETRKELTALLNELPAAVFTASDSLGWTYQFWQTRRKEEVNKSGVKIGADEISPVTQLFTEDYMVDFLLDNTLGAWWAGKQLALNPQLSTLNSEEELRQACALPGCPWKYLRFIKGKDGKWTPAAGTFEGWPKSADALRALDPCMGSGHFVVAMFERLVALRLAEEKLDEAAAVAAVIRDNLFGLEIDPRCTQIGAFNVALAAWRRVGHCKLPAMNLACSGLAPNTREADWLAIAGDNQKLQRGMERLYRLFQKAAVLGSLINPRAGEGDLLVAAFHELQPLLEKALAQETKDDTAHEMAVTARGLAKAAEILASQFTLVATNVPYLGRGKQDKTLQDFCESMHPQAKSDLATCFIERCLWFCDEFATTALVSPQNWWFSPGYHEFRLQLLSRDEFCFLTTLGEEAWQSFGDRGPVASLVIVVRQTPTGAQRIAALDALPKKTIEGKIQELEVGELIPLLQPDLLANPDSRLAFDKVNSQNLLSIHCESWQGLVTADNPRFMLCFWEVWGDGWLPFISSPAKSRIYGGRENVIHWMKGSGPLHSDGKAHNFPPPSALGKKGVLVSQVRSLAGTIYTGEIFAHGSSPIIPTDDSILPALWCFISSPDYPTAVRNIDKKLAVTNSTLVKVEFDLAHWQKVAAEKYPHGLPMPFSSDPTQWLFNGHPAGADQPLHVAVARLLGYQWPRQTGSSFPDCPALGPDGLETLADDDGIVCLTSLRGEANATDRLRELLGAALGSFDERELLAGAGKKGSKSKTLADWLRDEFFEQHCDLFHSRPFLWHLWDGRKDGFHALVSYHKLVAPNGAGRRTLESLTYGYLGDWITRQRDAVAQGESGAEDRLAAALELHGLLERILAGEPPHDLFIRWKPLHQQPIGWEPDLNDGVRLNARPFLATDLSRGKKGAGLFRAKPGPLHWRKDRGKEPMRPKEDFPWFWTWDEKTPNFPGGNKFDGNRHNDLHYTTAAKQAARLRQKTSS